MYIIVYLVYGGLVITGKLQRKKFRKHGTKENIWLPSIEDATNIGGGPDHNCFIIIEDGPCHSVNCIFQGLSAQETSMNAVKLSFKENVRCTE